MQPHAFTFGIEEEFFLVNAKSRQLARQVPPRLLRECQRRIGSVVCPELLQSQIEVASPVFESTSDAREIMPALRREISTVAESMGYRLVAAGTHPMARWNRQEATRRVRYTQLMEDFQIIGRRNVLCAMHVHCAVPPEADRVQLMNRLMPWIPVFLALSTSSPFWERQSTGLLSYRQAAYDEWPRTGIPDAFPDQAAYDQFVDLLVRQGAIPDASFLWWAIRPSLAHPTLELRICDSCTRVEDALALAALFRCLVRAYLRRPGLGTGRSMMSRRVIDENRWRAKRWGTDATFIDEMTEAPVPFVEKLGSLLDLVAEDASELDCEAELAHLRTLPSAGTSAHHQLRAFEDHCGAGGSHAAGLQAVVDWLADATLAIPGR